MRRAYNDKLDPEDLIDAEHRKGVFRAMAKDVVESIRDRSLTDNPGAIARMMEQAYRAGLAAAKADSEITTTERRGARMAQEDLGPAASRQIERMRHVLCGSLQVRPGLSMKEPAHLLMYMRPAHPGLPSTISHDEWFYLERRNLPGFSNKSMGPLLKSGLLRATEPSSSNVEGLRAGTRFAAITEWGFEMLLTGSTSKIEHRQPGRSSTFARYKELLTTDDDVVINSIDRFDLLEEADRPSSLLRGPRL